MNVLFTLIMLIALIAAIGFGVVFGIRRYRHTPGGHVGRSALIALATTIVSLGIAVATTPASDLTPAQAQSRISDAKNTHDTLAARQTKAKKAGVKLDKQAALLLAEVKKAKKAYNQADDARNAASASIAQAASAKAESESVAASAKAESESVAAAAASSRAVAASQAQAAQAATQASQAAAAAQTRSQAAAGNHTAPVNNGDMTTGGQGKIIGNARSKIYHVPGQASYRMNSANAVYFDTEQQAIAAGYRKSLR